MVRVEPDIPEELKEAKHITLNFDGTELYDVITTFCDLLKINYVIDESVTLYFAGGTDITNQVITELLKMDKQ